MCGREGGGRGAQGGNRGNERVMKGTETWRGGRKGGYTSKMAARSASFLASTAATSTGKRHSGLRPWGEPRHGCEEGQQTGMWRYLVSG